MIRNGVLRITLNRPEVHNAMDDGMVEGLRQEIERASMDRDIRAVVLAGAGPSFCSGADIGWLRDGGSNGVDEHARGVERIARMLLELDRLGKPVIARAHGHVMGGGMGLCAVSDVVIAATDARFALQEVRLGMVPSVIAPYLVRRLGPGRDRELILSGRRLNGEEAVRHGLAARAVDRTLLDTVIETLLDGILRGGPQAIARTKEMLRKVETGFRSEEDLLRTTTSLMVSASSGEEAQAGLTAFLEKTLPPWRAAVTERT